MKKIVLIVSFLFSISNFSQSKEIENVITGFFEAFHKQDSIALNKFCAEKMILQSINEGRTKSLLTEDKKADFIKSIVSIPKTVSFFEKILSMNIQIDGMMAHAWTPYEFYVNSKLSHSGVNSFQLYKDNGIWKIIYIIDTRRN